MLKADLVDHGLGHRFGKRGGARGQREQGDVTGRGQKLFAQLRQVQDQTLDLQSVGKRPQIYSPCGFGFPDIAVTVRQTGIMAFDPHAVLPRFAETYREHNGSDPYTDVWPWAQAIVRWHQEQDSPLPSGYGWLLGDDGQARDHLVAAVAESLRITMGWTGAAIGDLDLDALKFELRNWSEGDDGDSGVVLPGDAGWPAPSGPYADRWDALMHVLVSEPEQWSWILRSVYLAFTSLMCHASTAPHRASGSDTAVMDYRMRQTTGRRGDYRSLAEVAPSLGMSPVPVRDPRWYEGYDLVTTAEAG
ncbi:hypothetical protein [Streptomyces sp. enrichment culture]|uniref:hypothetical protein n=1 Tax=Streptomyces sp. enrichment culture TaxID=1795815 RepID=UPI003F562F35